MKHILMIMILLAVPAVLACGCVSTEENANAVQGSGTVVYIDLEGGFYGIVTDNGENYLPLYLPPEYEKDGIRVVFEGVKREDMFTIQQWGTPLDITSIHAGT